MDMMVNLNEAQKAAVLHGQGPAVVFAGAGSGKTRVITTRIARLIQEGVPPRRILALTFTNKAAQEMRERVARIAAQGGGDGGGIGVLITTFHAACARWLREFALELGYTGDFTIYDESDSKTVLKAVLRELNIKLDEKVALDSYRNGIAGCKTQGLLPSDIADLGAKAKQYLPDFGLDVYRLYQQKLAACNAMDFGDLIMNMLLLLRKNPGVQRKMAGRYGYVLVDEYQDTNPSQFELVSHLVSVSRNLFVVGDDDQSIYSWRGANPSNILDFDAVYPGCGKYFLEQNYRSTSTIINAASQVIGNNRMRAQKTLWTGNEAGMKIRYACEYDGETEAWWVCEQIRAGQNTYPLEGTAVFYRTNSQSRSLEEALLRDKIPYQIYGAVRFYERAEIKDLVAYLKLIHNANDDVAFERVVNVPARGIGDKALEDLQAFASGRGLSLTAAMREAVASEMPKLAKKFTPFLALLDAIREFARGHDPAATLDFVIEQTAYLRYVSTKFPDRAEDKLENIAELGSAIGLYLEQSPAGGISEWLQAVSLDSQVEGESGGVTLMTLHLAKGLEFDRVFIVGLEEGILPHRNSLDPVAAPGGGLEEERRLFYVGMTRARQSLILTSALRRRLYDRWVSGKCSRFLSEIPAEAVEFANDLSRENGLEGNGRTRAYEGSVFGEDDDDEADEDPERFMPGIKVEHLTFGRGIVERLEKDFEVPKVVVNFYEFGLRRIVAHHLRVIGR